MMLPRPCSPLEAIARCALWVSTGTYVLGAGGYHARDHHDDPYTDAGGGLVDACDCRGYVLYGYKLPGHRPGFNKGAWATVSDDINCDSLIEDAEHDQELGEVIERPELGALAIFPSIRDPITKKRIRIGHVSIIESIKRVAEWNSKAPQYDLLDVMECQSATRPAIRRASGAGWLWRDSYRGKKNPAWRSRLVRLKP